MFNRIEMAILRILESISIDYYFSWHNRDFSELSFRDFTTLSKNIELPHNFNVTFIVAVVYKLLIA